MTLRMSDVKWWRVIVLAVLVEIVSFLIVIVVITGYGSVLGFQARGAPDTAKIALFASQTSGFLNGAALLLLTFGAAAWLARRPNVSGPVNGLVLGILVGVLSFYSLSFDIGAIVTALLAVLAGWLGGSMGRRT